MPYTLPLQKLQENVKNLGAKSQITRENAEQTLNEIESNLQKAILDGEADQKMLLQFFQEVRKHPFSPQDLSRKLIGSAEQQGFDLALMLSDDINHINPTILEKARVSKIPILIKQGDQFFIYGDKNGSNEWSFKEIKNTYNESEKRYTIPENLFNNAPETIQFSTTLNDAFKEGHIQVQHGFAYYAAKGGNAGLAEQCGTRATEFFRGATNVVNVAILMDQIVAGAIAGKQCETEETAWKFLNSITNNNIRTLVAYRIANSQKLNFSIKDIAAEIQAIEVMKSEINTTLDIELERLARRKEEKKEDANYRRDIERRSTIVTQVRNEINQLPASKLKTLQDQVSNCLLVQVNQGLIQKEDNIWWKSLVKQITAAFVNKITLGAISLFSPIGKTDRAIQTALNQSKKSFK